MSKAGMTLKLLGLPDIMAKETWPKMPHKRSWAEMLHKRFINLLSSYLFCFPNADFLHAICIFVKTNPHDD